MKKVLLDTNIIFDFALKRESFYEDAQAILAKAADGDICGYITASTVTDIFYVLQKTNGKSFALNTLSDLITILEILPVDSQDIHSALHLGWDDFEDALQAQIAVRNGMDAIVTRNIKDFVNLQNVNIFSPAVFVKMI